MALSSTSRPALKGRVLPRLPATLTGAGGIAVEKENGIWTIHPDFSVLAEAPPLSDPSQKQVWVYDPITEVYNVITLAGFGEVLYSATSSSSLAVGVGSKTWATQSGRDFPVGSWVIAFGADPNNYMLGQVTAYVGTALTANVTAYGGTGTLASWTIRASSPPGAAGKSAGYSYGWLTATTSSDPGAGNIKANHATFASITSVYLSETDADTNAISAVIAAAASGTSTKKCRLKIYDSVTPTNFMEFDVTAITDNGTWDTLTVTPRSNGGSFSEALALRADFYVTGDKGETGAVPAIQFIYSTTTADADPGSGIFRLNNVTPASATAAYIDNNERGGTDVSAWIDTFDDNGNSTLRGILFMFDPAAPATFYEFSVSGSVVDGTGYRKLTIAYVSGQGALPNGGAVGLVFTARGPQGSGDTTGPASALDGSVALFDGTTGKLLKDAAVVLSAYAKTLLDDDNAAAALATLTARGQGTETISVPGLALWARTTAGPGLASRELTTGDDIMIKGLAFDATTEEAAQFYLRMPKSWNLGTVTAQVYWTNASGLTTETVTWGISAVALHDSDPMDSTSLGTEVTVTDTWLAQNDLHISSVTSAITFANTPAVGDLCIVQIARKTGTDNMTGDVELLDLVLFFTTNAATDA